MFVRNAWYVAGWSYEFPADGIVSRTLLNEPLVFYRKSDGGIVALEDRCVHRFAPLSLGCREGDNLRCMYHGLKFAPSGKCIEIPGHEEAIPERARVRSYPVVERHSWIWVWMGDAALADPASIPAAIGLDHPEWTLKSGQLDYDANYQLINDNLLDFSHLSYVHKSSFMADEQWARKRPKITRLERGVRVERWIDSATSFRSDTPRDHFSFYEFLVPGILLLGGKVYPAGTGRALGGEAPTEPPVSETFSCQAVTPVTDKTSRYFFSWGPRAGEGSEELATLLMGVAHKAFAEDKRIIEAQQKVVERSEDLDVMPTPADRAVLMFQRIMASLAREESDKPARAMSLGA
jgi:vanillate O-demethylase monooxygenase subunit